MKCFRKCPWKTPKINGGFTFEYNTGPLEEEFSSSKPAFRGFWKLTRQYLNKATHPEFSNTKFYHPNDLICIDVLGIARIYIRIPNPSSKKTTIIPKKHLKTWESGIMHWFVSKKKAGKPRFIAVSQTFSGLPPISTQPPCVVRERGVLMAVLQKAIRPEHFLPMMCVCVCVFFSTGHPKYIAKQTKL